ncbi:MAG: methyltransferase domain-containing protein, partial [Desulfovibrio sp.]|nr:methyltransferase domain-containing protein [Desulfovibrio sp.]
MRDILRDREGAVPMLGEELMRLALPPLAGSAFLEIGCHEGYFCGFAWFEGAGKVIGLDADTQALERAAERFPHCAFSGISGNFAKLLVEEGGFDVILCSFLPGFLDTASFLPLLMSGLTRGGTLVLKLPMAEQAPAEGRTITQAALAGPALSPAEPRVAQALDAYVYWDMGESVFPTEDGSKKHILHIRNKAPYAILLPGEPGSGKAGVARRLFAGLPVIHGDTLLTQLAALPPGSLKESHPLLDRLCSGGQHAQSAQALMLQVFNSAAGIQYAHLLAEMAGGRDFVYQGYVHEGFRQVFKKQLEMLGYEVLGVE